MRTGTLVDVQTRQKMQILFVFGRFMHFDAKHMVMIGGVCVGGGDWHLSPVHCDVLMV